MFCSRARHSPKHVCACVRVYKVAIALKIQITCQSCFDSLNTITFVIMHIRILNNDVNLCFTHCTQVFILRTKTTVELIDLFCNMENP